LVHEKGAVIATVGGRSSNDTPPGVNFFIPIDDALKALALTPGAS
jgi:hypothetical protein